MRTTTITIALSCVLGAVAARAADDDLTVVKRAVQHPEDARPAVARRDARWFRVRVDKRKGGKVRINLPLPFVRAPLGALDAGQKLVAIEGEDASVRIWID